MTRARRGDRSGELDPDEQDKTLIEREAELSRQKEHKARLKNDRTTLLKRPDFQRVMSDIIARSGMFQSVMTGNAMTYHKSGRQDFGREIWVDMADADRDRAHDLLKPKLE